MRKAASVLPEPVGAAISVWRPERIAPQPSSCASVGGEIRPLPSSRKCVSHQRRRMGWKSSGSMTDEPNILQTGYIALAVCTAAHRYAAIGCSRRSSGLFTPRPPLLRTCV